jgi:hypothetical protein
MMGALKIRCAEQQKDKPLRQSMLVDGWHSGLGETIRRGAPIAYGGVNEMKRLEIWLRGIIAAAISGASGGVLTAFAAVGIDPQHFNLQAGMGATFRIGAAAALINAVIGVAAYLQKSPLPSGD